MKRFLVTGSSGLLGSNLVFEIGKKYEISGVYKSHPNPEVATQFQVDLTDEKRTMELLARKPWLALINKNVIQKRL